MWEPIEHRLALLELTETGNLKRRRSQRQAFDWLSELPWTRATGRSNELAAVEQHLRDLSDLLDRTWPEWQEEAAALSSIGAPPTLTGWSQLQDHRRTAAIGDLPPILNRKTAAAAVAGGSKSNLTNRRLEVLPGVELTTDAICRLRVPRGLTAHRNGKGLELDRVVTVLGEIGIADRALRDGLRVEGQVKAYCLIENLATWADLPHLPDWVYIFVPGWDISPVANLLGAFPPAPVVHFGDLDPNGVKIHKALRESIPGLLWLVPDYWAELVETHAQPKDWAPEADLQDTPPLVQALARRGLWLEQESLVLDQRLSTEMRRLVELDHSNSR